MSGTMTSKITAQPLQRIISSAKTSSSPRVPDKKWHEHITLDVLLAVLNRTILHPFVAWVVVLCLRAQVTPYTDTAFIIATGYAIFITVLGVASTINQRIGYGLPRPVELSEEVIVVTGGASGLGLLIARIYGLRGVSVAVLDIKDASELEGWEEVSGVDYYRCDIGNRDEVEAAARKIEKDVSVPCPIYWLSLQFYPTQGWMEKERKKSLFLQ